MICLNIFVYSWCVLYYKLSSFHNSYFVYFICFSDVKRTKNKKEVKKWSVRKLFTLLRHFLKMSTNNFKPCSYIELNTQNPNTIFKITICYTKLTQNTKILSTFFEKSKNRKISKCYFVFCINCIIHSLYLLQNL